MRRWGKCQIECLGKFLVHFGSLRGKISQPSQPSPFLSFYVLRYQLLVHIIFEIQKKIKKERNKENVGF